MRSMALNFAIIIIFIIFQVDRHSVNVLKCFYVTIYNNYGKTRLDGCSERIQYIHINIYYMHSNFLVLLCISYIL